MSLTKKIKYYYSKLVLYIQTPSISSSKIDKTAKIGHKSNLINTKVGRYSYCGNNNSISYVEIGSFCSIASYCAIGGKGHPIEEVSTSPVFYDKNNWFKKYFGQINSISEPKLTKIGNDVWIGEACFIKEGVNIGDGAVIGAHSVVTKDVPPYSVVVGSPAKVLRYRFDEETIRDLLKLQWWDWETEKIELYGKYFHSPSKLIQEVRDKNI